MVTARLHKVGGSTMLPLPPAFVAAMDAKSGDRFTLELHGNVLTIKPAKSKYVLADLMAKCDLNVPWTSEDREWIDEPPVGQEML